MQTRSSETGSVFRATPSDWRHSSFLRPALALLICILSTVAILGNGPAERLPAEEGARICVDLGRRVVNLFATYSAEGSDSLTYEMEATRTGVSGKSATRQAGTFKPAPGRTDTLSTIRLSISDGDRLEVRLVVRDGTRIVSSDRFHETMLLSDR